MSDSAHEQRITQALQEEAARAVPDTLDLWPALWRQASAAPAPQRSWRPALLALRATLVTALLLAVGLGAYAVAPLLGPSRLDLGGAYVPLTADSPLTRTVNGYTITLQPLMDGPNLVADANQIMLVCTVTDPQGQRVSATHFMVMDSAGGDGPRLTARDGATFRWRGVTTVIPSDGTEPSAPARYQQTLVFDTGGRGDLPATFALHLALNLRVGDGQVFVSSTVPRPAPPQQIVPGDRSVPLIEEDATWPHPILQNERLVGAVAFTFLLPMDTLRRVAEVYDPVVVSDIAMTLQRVVVTRSETRVLLRFPAPDRGTITRWSPVVVDLHSLGGGDRLQLGELQLPLLRAGGWETDQHWTGSNMEPTDLLSNKETEWLLVVRSLQTEGVDSSYLAGPWIFRFTLPPATTGPTAP